ncbi:MAG TPA: hypothetical protein VF092_28700 [Longimicrobium sp.]
MPEFTAYADFSVRVDRYFHFVCIYGLHHSRLQFVAGELARTRYDPLSLPPEITDTLSGASYVFAQLAATQIFAEPPGAIDSRTLPDDVLNFAFYTCFSFQWNLFENVLRKLITRLSVAGLLSQSLVAKLSTKGTARFLDLLHNEVFPASPFVAVLPVPGWAGDFEQLGYADLKAVRELRNGLVHGIDDPSITAEDALEKQRRYDRAMWMLRTFAANVQHETVRMLGAAGTSLDS